MQLRSFFATIALTLTSWFALAQNVHPSKKADTSSSQIAPSGALLASNVTTPSNPAITEKTPYGKVPLAGEKAYYGDKNDFMKQFVRNYLEHNNQTLNCVQRNCEKPFAVIDDQLEQTKMPVELKYLAVIESALNQKAVSRAGAVGPWQLMESTARLMGLNVSKKVDERTDWNKSTKAALKYLDYLYTDLQDWLLVVAAYNSGPTPVLRAIAKTGSRNFWDIKEHLPKETQGHVLSFIATATIFEQLNKFISLGSLPMDFKFGKDKEEEAVVKELLRKTSIPVSAAPSVAVPAAPSPTQRQPVAFTEEELKNMVVLKIDEPIYPEVMEHEAGIDKKLIARWNSDYDLFLVHKYPTEFYKLKLPKDKLDVFLQKKQTLIQLSRKMFTR